MSAQRMKWRKAKKIMWRIWDGAGFETYKAHTYFRAVSSWNRVIMQNGLTLSVVPIASEEE